MTEKPLKPATIAARAAGAMGAGGAVVPGVELATTFARDAVRSATTVTAVAPWGLGPDGAA